MFLCLKNNKAEEHKEYVSYVPMSKNNTMTHMYRTILLALPALLLLAACADDVTPPAAGDPATLAGQPVRFTATGLAVTPADAPRTRATQETDFPAEGSTMTVYMTGNGNTWQADYTYSTANGWTSTAPLLWPDTQNEYTFTAISPKGTDPEITLPTEWTAETLAEHEEIRTTAEEVKTTATQSLDLPLCHALVKVQVISISGQPVTVKDGETFMQLYSADETTYEGYLTPASGTEGFQFISDNVYTVGTALVAGTVVTTCDLAGGTVIACPRQGRLSEVWPAENPQKVVITGKLDATDMSTINGHKDEITHLYVINGSTNGDDWKRLNMSGATQLESVYLAEATSIEDFAFQSCSALTSVSLPQAESIGIDAFLQCSELTSVSLPKATSIGEMAFQNCSALTSVCLPKATTIGDIAFEQCSALESISLPEATSIGNNAFQLCEQLTSVSLPEATSIGNYAFASCSQLASVSLPKATSIGDNAFYDCGALTSVSLPKNANIENNAFEACYKLTTLFLSNCPETEFDATEYNNNPNYGNHGWTTIHYGYIGTDGDYLKESNYAYHWPNN